MLTAEEIKTRFNKAFPRKQAVVLADVFVGFQDNLVKADIGGREISIFERAEREGRKILVVGESKLRLDAIRGLKKGEKDVFGELEDKAKALTIILSLRS